MVFCPSVSTGGAFEVQFRGKGCYFLVFVQLFEKYGTLIERNTALIEKVSPCRVRAGCKRSPGRGGGGGRIREC
eukprot:SAG31_NODE_18747_length_624_cov_0.880000_1_plen_73_part_10